jgi:zinc transport system ATP-binding protein
MSILVELNEVSKYARDSKIIDCVSFQIEQGEITTLIGPNGAGKSTLARLILGLDRKYSGTIKVLSNLSLGYVPQKLEINPGLPITVECFVNLINPNSDIENHPELSDFADFKLLKNKDISELSGGQMQKLLLSATFSRKPDLLILDEPTHSLDLMSQERFYELISNIVGEESTSIFMISHDLHIVGKNSDKVICLNKHVCCSGRPGDLEHSREFVQAASRLGLYFHYHDHSH